MTSGSRKIVFFVLIIGLAYVSYAYMIKPANLHLNQVRNQVKQKRSKLSELAKATADADDLNKQLERVKDAIRVFESKLPPRSAIDAVLTDVTLIARKQGLVSKKIRALKNKNSNGYIEQPLEMELDGNFNSYYSFLLELERLDRITKIRELTLKKKSKHEGQTEAKFVMSIFFQGA